MSNLEKELTKDNVISRMLKILLSSDNPKSVLHKVFDGLGQVFDLHKICLFKYFSENNEHLYSELIGWERDRVNLIYNSEETQYKPFTKTMNRFIDSMMKDEAVFRNIEDFPEDEQKDFGYRNIKSILVVPVFVQGNLWGFTAFADCEKRRSCPDEDYELFTSISICIVDSVLRHNSIIEIEKSESRLKNALSTAGEGVWDCDLVAGEIYFSDHIKVLYNIKSEKSIFKFEELKNSEFFVDVDNLTENFVIKLISNKGVVSSEYRIMINDELHWFSLTGSVIEYSDTGQALRAVGITSDITERKLLNLKLNDALERAEISSKAKSTFLANMSHEIRTPINGIMGFLRLLKEQKLDETSYEYLRIIENSTETLLELINSILDISKIEAGNATYEEVTFNLTTDIEGVARLFSASAYSKKVMLRTFIDPKIPKLVSADQLKGRQIVSNILNNALKFTESGGSIYLEAKVVEKDSKFVSVKFSITDTGIGISADKLDEIFKPFSQSDNSISRKYGGTGLGLAIAQEFVSMMGGNIYVESKLGAGSTFFFTLKFPIVEEVEFAPSCSCRVSCIEVDYPSNTISDILETIGCKPRGYSSFKELLESDEDKGCAIIISTFYVKEELLASLRKLRRKFDKVNILLIAYPIDSILADEFKKINIALAIRPFSIMRFNKILKTLISGKGEFTKLFEDKELLKLSGRVLVAEDNEINSKLILIVLKKYGLDVVLARNGREAVDKFDENFKLIFMDINMPEMDGLTATSLIRNMEYEKGLKKKTPIVALTANAMKDDIDSYLRSGINAVLSKPFIAEELETILKRYI